MLLGVFSPSGTLPYTIFAENVTQQLPMASFRMRPDEKSGYPGRTYRFSNGNVLFPFGHGLSYTDFALEWAVPCPSSVSGSRLENPGVTYKVKVTNVGERPGSKVVQLFVALSSSESSSIGPSLPKKSLFAMEKVYLESGESAILTFSSKIAPGSRPFARVTWDGNFVALKEGTMSVSVGAYSPLSCTTRVHA